jgi:hypothetical protein
MNVEVGIVSFHERLLCQGDLAMPIHCRPVRSPALRRKGDEVNAKVELVLGEVRQGKELQVFDKLGEQSLRSIVLLPSELPDLLVELLLRPHKG